MTRTLTLAALAALSLHYSYGDDLTKAPAFEVASITPCKPGTPAPPGEHAGMVQFTYPGGRFRATATTLKFLLEWAYDIQPSQHSPGPSWIEQDRYDVVAKAEGNATDPQMKRMLQALLAERFQLKLHHESKELPVYVISVGKTAPKLFPPKDEEKHSIRIEPQMGQDQKIASFHVVATRFSLTQLTDTFARQLGRVIVNKTGLDGDFDFSMDLTPDDSSPNPLDPSLLINAMRNQLGLSLQSQKAAVDYLVIDGAEKVVEGN
ncbi:MAG TPA: TIGR03435 family protein [Bryobacteraceae bacterium]|jgi:uncharacterized protein (TIGR03435 family)|nr:TIGR03435 family protein [Bryobacteraceae bacterium]